jgi:serine/threonine-protein kinase HipA
MGNCDAHAKNVSLLLSSLRGTRLAPFYDLVCTRVYKPLDRNLAMSFGDQSDPGQVIRRDLEAYAREIQMGSGLVFALVEEFLTETPQKLEEAAQEFRDHYGDSPILEMVRLQVAKNLKRAANTIR